MTRSRRPAIGVRQITLNYNNINKGEQQMPVVYLQRSSRSVHTTRRSSIAAAIESFADEHHLRARTRDDDDPTTSLCFEHPRGGHVTIEITANAGNVVRIVSRWWQDDYDSFSRNIRRHVATGRWTTTDAMLRMLDATLTRIIAWQPGQWTESERGYEAQWSWFTRREFEHAVRSRAWPQPRLSH